jgi:DeoR family transcriptional regulator, fructose operon transcriptional repressor
MLRPERELKIINKLRAEKIVHLTDLSSAIGVSENTIRRDLQRLQSLGILKRTHGGAVLVEEGKETHSSEDVDWLERLKQSPLEKERIGKQAAGLVHDGEAIILDAGTTTMQVARHLQDKRGLTVVTNAVNIGLELAHIDSITVVLTGGILRELSKSLVGPLTEEFLVGNIHVDTLFLSARGVSIEAGVTNANTVEVPIKRAMIKAARQVILVVTHEKLGKQSFTQITPLETISAIVTDSGADPSLVAAIEAKGVRVIIA